VVIEREIPVQPEDIEDGLYPIADHRRIASKPKRDEALHILRQMRGQGDTERVSGNLFIPEAMSRRETQFTPGELAEAIEGVSKGGFLPLLACGKTVSSTIKVAEGKQWWVLIGWLVSCGGHTEARPLRGRRVSEASTRAHPSTRVLK
jgi:hypothetical protein